MEQRHASGGESRGNNMAVRPRSGAWRRNSPLMAPEHSANRLSSNNLQIYLRSTPQRSTILEQTAARAAARQPKIQNTGRGRRDGRITQPVVLFRALRRTLSKETGP